MDNTTRTFQLRTMSYRHFINTRNALRRSETPQGAAYTRQWRADGRAFVVALHYHNALAIPYEAS